MEGVSVAFIICSTVVGLGGPQESLAAYMLSAVRACNKKSRLLKRIYVLNRQVRNSKMGDFTQQRQEYLPSSDCAV